ncbi:hypothetical protein [uncultured Winogradskyella sp.]|uniref:hypothetical protein n=1 Tax=uncultured Winogradskyella sp. TaxID=395353 RepID=UPI00261B908E|nr:hypothetical protein [uncultured Winogradskyella sp.]
MKKDKLHNIKSTGFKTPEKYFASFDEKIFEHISEKKFIEEIETSGYSTPKNYFDTVEDNILKNLDTEVKPIVHLMSRKNFYYVAGIAASLLLLFAIFINKENVNEISAEMVETYLEDQDLDSYEIAQLLTDADILEEDFTIIETTYNEDNLEAYLLENADIETIIEQ